MDRRLSGDMIEALAKLVAAYLLGTLMGGQVIGFLKGGVDLRKVGSGNVGATNALRTQGKAFAIGVLLIDVAKGVAAVTLIPMVPWPLPGGGWPQAWIAYACGIGVALGHCYPVFYRFQGGKGVATLAGVFATLMTPAIGWILGAFALVVILTGYVALASVSAALVALFYAACVAPAGAWSATGAFTAAMAALVIWKHRENLLRIARGQEHRFERARLLHRGWERWRKA